MFHGHIMSIGGADYTLELVIRSSQPKSAKIIHIHSNLTTLLHRHETYLES